MPNLIFGTHPEFRRKFYYDLLPALNQAGVTIVAITHTTAT
jgi:ABC-type siderophore export system fused ATPase/permease subunit